jgi:hypothetical protein
MQVHHSDEYLFLVHHRERHDPVTFHGADRGSRELVG